MSKPYDPTLITLRGLISKDGRKLTSIAKHAGISQSCLKAWMDGTTRRPQHWTMNTVLNALGYRFEMVNLKESTDVDKGKAEKRNDDRHPAKASWRERSKATGTRVRRPSHLAVRS